MTYLSESDGDGFFVKQVIVQALAKAINKTIHFRTICSL
jgi:hypothetical protein